MDSAPKKAPRRRDDRVILHFCVENRQPSLKGLPLGIKQKGILATCNYVARRRGVKKLMPIAAARNICPDLVLADGEDLSPFRDVSKRLYALLRSYSWSGKVERLGLDEVFLDVTDIVSFNVELLNSNALQQSYFCLSRSDPAVGFEYDATSFAGCVLGDDGSQSHENVLYMRLLVASHLAQYLRLRIEEEGYTTACGIATNKLLAKLAGDKNKPRNQTTLLSLRQEDVLTFMDEHSLRKVPGIGSRITRVLEGFVLGKEPDPDLYTMECSTTVGQVRTHPGISPPTLSRLLSGPGAEKNLGPKVWTLLHGVDDTAVQPARDIPTQISIEDSYRGLTQPSEIRRALLAITSSLLRRMHTDLVEEDVSPTTSTASTANPVTNSSSSSRWLARPRTLRLSTRPYTTPQDDKPYNWARHSRSCPLPSFVFNTSLPQEERAERLVTETLLPLFYNTGGGWNIGLLNVCVANMSAGGGGGVGDIGAMFRRQEGVLREFTVYARDEGEEEEEEGHGLEQKEEEEEEEGGLVTDTWDNGDDDDDDTPEEEDSVLCPVCDRLVPRFAVSAHERYHRLGDA
ncbi:hypothetical protein C8A01DRAFT_44696 [Parachaetomium inaequale]|uniref:UmuC domain-containing protein n=1 Tax=Parachaetomium inaequale TaxID=2588326 RepID=A0AAN6PNX8_9PEZI|nr:hypothetical protein C8A01DRAFT_44696 [Parachaetomium inaequale]